MLTSLRLREQRSSSEDSVIKLLQYSPVIYESEDDDALAISAEAFERMQKYKEAAETSDSDRELLCYTAEVKVGALVIKFDISLITIRSAWCPALGRVSVGVQCSPVYCVVSYYFGSRPSPTAPV